MKAFPESTHVRTAGFVLVLFSLCYPIVQAQTPTIAPIIAPKEPNAIHLYTSDGLKGPAEEWETFAGARIVRNVTQPTLTPVLPDPAKANGTAVIVAPGGAFLMLSIDTEGYQVAHWLADRGITAFVLKYRLKSTPRDPAAYLATLSSYLGDAIAHPPFIVPTPAASLDDAEAGVELVRNRAKEWKVDPARIGFLGFSAGAALTQTLALTALPKQRPDFIASIYGPLTGVKVPANAPPLFAAVAADDPLFGRGDFELISSWRKADRPVEFHYFEKGGHGFGMNQQGTTSDLWTEELYQWLKGRGLLQP